MESEYLDRRRYPRLSASLEIIMDHPTLGFIHLITRDFSENGIFLLTNDIPMPPLGTIVDLRVPNGSGESLPQQARIIRQEEEGVALAFC